jgi:hypothetical protein
MSIRSDYFRYLDHFGPTVPVRTLAESPGSDDLVALRHDVDYDLNLAMELSFWEWQHGARSSYYILDTAPYWNDPDLVEKCLQIQDFGHEVGLHINVLAKWYSSKIDDIEFDLKAALSRLRDGGVEIQGICAHGDRLCYEGQFINYWCFSELRPRDPTTAESGLCAEGIPVSDPKFQIDYPATNALRRADGSVLPLWSSSLSRHRLSYDALHVPYDHYFSDSGGSWSRTPDPILHDFSRGRCQVLMHPIYWRGEQRLYFFLSTARSGSKWLSQYLDRATSVIGRHEFILNHRYEDQHLKPENHTFDELDELLETPDEVHRLMMQAREWIQENNQDYGEANIYLAQFMLELNKVYPDSVKIHLHRNPGEVIRSLINRDWYDTPEDYRHPRIAVEDWEHLDQFSKACWYVRDTNERLEASTSYHLVFERMVSDPNYLSTELSKLGIAVYPRFASGLFADVVNESKRHEFPKYSEWAPRQKNTYWTVCGPICDALGYLRGDALDDCRQANINSTGARATGSPLTIGWYSERKLLDIKPGGVLSSYRFEWRTFIKTWNKCIQLLSLCPFISIAEPRKSKKEMYYGYFPWGWKQIRMVNVGCRLSVVNKQLSIQTDSERNARLVMGGGDWHHADRSDGWAAKVGYFYRGEVAVSEPGGSVVSVFCLMYDNSGDLMDKRLIAQLSEKIRSRHIGFKVRPKTHRFKVAIHAPKTCGSRMIVLNRLDLEEARFEVDFKRDHAETLDS